MQAIVHILRVRPASDDVPLERLFVEAKRAFLELPNGDFIEVFRLTPLGDHSDDEQKYIEKTFPYFQSRIIAESDQPLKDIGGYLLTAIPGQKNDKRFDAYFPLAEAMLERLTR